MIVTNRLWLGSIVDLVLKLTQAEASGTLAHPCGFRLEPMADQKCYERAALFCLLKSSLIALRRVDIQVT